MSAIDSKLDLNRVQHDSKGPAKRIRLPSDYESLSVGDFIKYWDHQNFYVDQLENTLKEYEEKLVRRQN